MNNLYDEITIRIRPIEGTIRVEEHTGGVVSVKTISPDGLLACIAKGAKESKAIRSGFLPGNCVSYDVSNRHKTVALWIPPGHVDLTYHKTVYERFPMPAMAFSFKLDASGRTSGHRMAVIADGAPAPGTQVYAYPFSNVSQNGDICVGAANSLPAYRGTRALGTLPYHILSLPNNDHGYSRSNNRMGLTYRDLLEHLRDKEPQYYYGHVLLPRGATLQGFIDNNMGGKTNGR